MQPRHLLFDLDGTITDPAKGIIGSVIHALETLGVRYEEEFVRTAEGWRIRVRDATRLWSQITPTPYEPLLIDRAAARARDGR